jgi:hypothetical protein
MIVNILGCDGSHGEEYARLFRNLGADVHVWDIEQSKSNVVAQSVEGVQVIRNLQCIHGNLSLVTGRYANSHKLPALSSLERGIPTYIDKPGLETPSDLEELLAVSKSNGTPVSGYSPLVKSLEYTRFTDSLNYQLTRVRTPAFCSGIDDERAKCISFYSSHGVDLVTFDKKCRVSTVSVRKTSAYLIWDILFSDGDNRSLELTTDKAEIYTLYGRYSGLTNAFQIDPYGDFYSRVTGHLVAWSASPIDYSDHIRLRNSADVMAAIKVSFLEGIAYAQ